MSRKIAPMEVTKEVPLLVRNEEVDIVKSYVPDIKIFQNFERHIDATSYGFSDP